MSGLLRTISKLLQAMFSYVANKVVKVPVNHTPFENETEFTKFAHTVDYPLFTAPGRSKLSWNRICCIH